MQEGPKRLRSYLFTVRLWDAELIDGQAEWRGKIEHIKTGEARYFHDWNTLIALLNMMLPAQHQERHLETIREDGQVETQHRNDEPAEETEP